MPRYQFRCRTCDAPFEIERPMDQASDPAPCPDGHSETVRLLSTFAAVTGNGGPAPAPVTQGGGGFAGCGAGCACAH